MGYSCRDRVPGKLGGLGHDRGFLCRDRDFSTLCRDINFVSRQGLGAGPGLGHDKDLLVSRQGFPKGRTFPVTT